MVRTIDVTEDDIRRGFRMDCHECPIALAISRATGQVVHVEQNGVVTLLGSDECVDLPGDVIDRILEYDDGEPMEPFSFELSGLSG